MMFTFLCVVLLSLLTALIIFVVWADSEIDKEVYIETTVLEERVDLIKEKLTYLHFKFAKDKILPEQKKTPVITECVCLLLATNRVVCRRSIPKILRVFPSLVGWFERGSQR